jgi:hypothetical protein
VLEGGYHVPQVIKPDKNIHTYIHTYIRPWSTVDRLELPRGQTALKMSRNQSPHVSPTSVPTKVAGVGTASDLVRAEEDGQEGRLWGPACKRPGHVRGCARAVAPEGV